MKSDLSRTPQNQQVPWRQAKKILFPYADPVEKDKQWITDRDDLFKLNGKDWMVKLWNKFW
jgi:hypothetical protein|tara:strand:+ start:29866 stop:30048 length:183 start_codon:yes stop_codon:yes gene_type:complete